jgi:hypothetical protein
VRNVSFIASLLDDEYSAGDGPAAGQEQSHESEVFCARAGGDEGLNVDATGALVACRGAESTMGRSELPLELAKSGTPPTVDVLKGVTDRFMLRV